MIRKFIKFLIGLFLVLVIIGFLTYLFINEPVPEGTNGVEAEELADEMLSSLNKEAFDTLKYIGFTFREKNSYQWDLENNTVTVEWDEQSIFLDLNRGKESFNLLEYKAYKFFINDTFWLIAPFKVRDDGVIRSTVDLSVGRGLLVTYTSGGETPGDSYLWIIDEKGFPVAWKLWTSNVPIGGLKFTWEGWTNHDAWFSTLHKSSILEIPITNLEVR